MTEEWLRGKIVASKQKGLWMGGRSSQGYDIHERTLGTNDAEATLVQHIYARYLALSAVGELTQELHV